MVNVALWVVVGIVVVTAFFVFNQKYLYKNTIKNHTPMMTKRFARHPNGEISTIDYHYINDNKKRMWKFHEWEQEIHAEFVEDIIVQPGAEDGNAFYIFRYNRNGNEISWDEPKYNDYFERMKKMRDTFDKIKQKSFQEKDLEQMSKQSFKKMVSDGFDEDYAENQFSMEKKLMEYWMKSGKGKGSLPPFMSKGRGVKSGETESA